MATAIAAFTFTACEDVPEPYNNPYNGHEVEPVEVIDPAGSGTADDPWNVAAIIAACNGLEDGAYLKNGEEVYVTGIVTEINELSTQYGNATYHISDDVKGSNSFYVYRGKMLGGASVASEDDLKEGYVVTVCGKVKNYKGTMEFDQGNYLVSLNGEGGGDTPDAKTIGTKDAPKTVAEAITAIDALGSGATSDEFWFIKGKVKQIKTTAENIVKYKNIDYIITDDGNNELTVFRGKNLDDTDFTSADELKVGDEVVVYGQLTKYVNPNTNAVVPEVAQGNYIVSKSSGGTTPSGDVKTVTIAEFNAASVSNDVWYQLTGTVKNLKDGDIYGNFDLEDATGSVYVYGLLSEKGGEKKKFQELVAAKGIKEGSKITIIGTRGEYSGKIEVMNAYFVSIEEGGATPKGSGTLADPYNVAGACAFTQTLAQDEPSEPIYVKGYISEIHEVVLSYGNAAFYISDTKGSTNGQMYVFRSNYLQNEKFTAENQIKVGDEVIMFGPVLNYKGNTPEFTVGTYIYQLNGSTTGGNTPTPGGGTGTLDKPLSASQAYDIVAAMEAGVTSSEDYYVKGKIVSIKYTFSAQYGTATFNISDDGNASDKEFIAYSCYYFNNQPWVDGNTQVEVGNEVIVCGKVVNYNGNTPEFASKKNWLVSLNGNTGEGGGVTPGGNTEGDVSIDFSAQGYENQQEIKDVTLSDGTKLSFNAGDNNNAPKYYNSGSAIRMYPSNYFTVTASKKIAEITINCSLNNGEVCNAEGQVTASPGTVAVADMKVTVSGINETTTKITNSHGGTGAASQLRVSSISITYAK